VKNNRARGLQLLKARKIGRRRHPERLFDCRLQSVNHPESDLSRLQHLRPFT
jgi:hypothetical protein